MRLGESEGVRFFLLVFIGEGYEVMDRIGVCVRILLLLVIG